MQLTFSAENDYSAKPMKQSTQTGFTLVEMIVVLGLIGLFVTAVIMSLPKSDGGLRAEQDRLALLIDSVRDNAILQSRPMAIRISENQYLFEVRAEGTWQELSEKPFNLYKFPNGNSANLHGQEFVRIAFDSTGLPIAGAEIKIMNENKAGSISVDTSGKVAVIPASN